MMGIRKMTLVFCAVIAGLAAPVAYAARYSVPRGVPELIESGKITEARERVQEFRRKEPDNPLAIFYLARIEEDRNLARALYKEVERFADSDLASQASLARAEMFIEEGDYQAAAPLLEAIISSHPDGAAYADALYRLGMIRLKEDKTDEALVLFQKSRAAQSGEFKKTLAGAGIMECRVARKEWNQAVDAAREVLEGDDDAGALTPRVLEVIVLSWRHLGNEENAIKYTQRLINDFPSSYQAYMLREKGDRIAGNSDYSLGRAPSGSTDSSQAGDENAASRNETPGIRSGMGFSVQAGAFTDRFNALKVYNRLKDSGFPVRVDMKTVDEKHFYLVRIGVYETREEADKIALKVTGLTGAPATVIILE